MEFIEEECELRAGESVRRMELFTAYREWCAREKRQSLGRMKFYDAVESAGLKGVTSGSTGGNQLFRGLALKSELGQLAQF